MIRSVMVKGMEALTAECLLAAKRAGVEQAVLASLGRSHPDIEWARRSSYNIERMRLHGKRRAAEMREVASTLRELGLPDRMAAATASWEEQVGRLGLAGSEASLDEELKRVLAAIG
jgi:3-hydroxyisobutyrate dehydrogenase-like beta-hydroxyacid dehydrogenase